MSAIPSPVAPPAPPAPQNGAAPAPRYRTFKPFDDDTLAMLEASHGRIAVVRGATPEPRRWARDDKPEPPWECVFRAPTLGEAEMFEGNAHNESAKRGALRNHAKATIVAVSVDGKHVICETRADLKSVKAVREAFDSLREKFPGVHLAAQEDLQALMGSVRDDAGKE